MGIKGLWCRVWVSGGLSNTVEFVRRKEIVAMMCSCDGIMV